MDNQTPIDKLTALKILAYRKKFEKYRSFIPNGKAQEFAQAVLSGDNFVSLFSAANGVGKTATACNIVANICYNSTNPYFKDLPLVKKFPYLKRGRIVSDPTTIKQKIIPELKLWFPAGKYTTSKAGRDYEYLWETHGSEGNFIFDVMTYEQDAKEFESVDLGWCWFDEPPPEMIYKATVSRFRRGGIILITATPLTGSAWMYDAIMTKRVSGQRAVVEADVEANCIQHGVRGILNHSDILRMVAEYSAEDRQARIFGKFQHLTGLVFKRFSPTIHIIKPFVLKEEDFSTIELLDCHPRNEDALMWVATRKDGVKFIVDEIYQRFDSQEELAARVKKVAAQYRLVGRFADPSAWADVQPSKTVAAGIWKTTGQQLEELGLDYQPASKHRSQGIQLINNALDYQIIQEGEAKRFIKPPMLYVFDTCVRTIWEFSHWQYNEWTGKAVDKKDRSEKPQDKDDHMMENLGRAFLNDPGFVAAIRQYNPPSVAPSLDPYEQSAVMDSLDPYS